jgi:Predicted thioesterase
MITKTHFSVKLTEIDSFGIVHHSNYPLWFEAGRRDFLKNTGITNYKLNTLGFFLPLTELRCDFKNPARFGDEIVVITNLVYMSYVKIKFDYMVLKKRDENIITTGKTTHAWSNRSIEPINIKKAAPEIYNNLLPWVES